MEISGISGISGYDLNSMLISLSATEDGSLAQAINIKLMDAALESGEKIGEELLQMAEQVANPELGQYVNTMV